MSNIMNKLIIPIIVIAIIAAGIGAYFILQKPVSDPPISKCGDGICQLTEKQKGVCPKDCEKKPEKTCKDLCGDGICQETVCMAIGCPCAETFESCPQDCEQTADKCPQIVSPSPILEEQCEKDNGKLEPKKNEKGCIIGYECKKPTACAENWQCSDWSACSDNQQTRTCTDKNNCGTAANKPAESQNCEEVTEEISSVSLLKKVDIKDGARPEVVAADNRVFVVYLDRSSGSNQHSVKIFDKDMNTEIAYKNLFSKSSEYGSPIDIRVASDGNYVYAFHYTEDAAVKKESWLFGAKYNQDDSFERVAYTGLIATSKSYRSHEASDEHLDDPIVLIGQSSVFAITRIISSSVYTYVVREFDKNLNFKKTFNVDLSGIAQTKLDHGQASAVYYNGYYYMVIPSMKGVSSLDLFMIKFDTDWNIADYRFISQSSQDEWFVTGMRVYGDYFFVAYKEGEFSGAKSILKVFDNDFNLITHTTVKEQETLGESMKPSLSVNNDKAYVGLSSGGGIGAAGTAHIYILEIK